MKKDIKKLIYTPKLPKDFKVFGVFINNSIFIEVHNKFYKNKIVTLPTSYSNDYPYKLLIDDVENIIIKKYNLTWIPGRYA